MNHIITKAMKKTISAIALLLFFSVTFISCNSSSSSKSNNCPICGKELTESNKQIVTAANGERMTVCYDCAAVGRIAGKCF